MQVAVCMKLSVISRSYVYIFFEKPLIALNKETLPVLRNSSSNCFSSTSMPDWFCETIQLKGAGYDHIIKERTDFYNK